MNTELIHHINLALDCNLPEDSSFENFKSLLTKYINELINHRFDVLIQQLYKIDVSEEKLKTILAGNNGENAAELIATLMIERQLQKIESRNSAKPKDDIPEDEKW